MFSRDSRSVYPSDNYALEDVSGIMYDFQGDILYTGMVGTDHQWQERALGSCIFGTLRASRDEVCLFWTTDLLMLPVKGTVQVQA